MGGQRSAQMVTQASQQRVQGATAAGWALRQKGITAGDGNHDPELDSWLARRFGGPLPKQTEEALPEGVVRAGDSPRTASWRATVAQLQPARSKSRALSQSGRQRSESPSLDNWIARRNQVKGSEEAATSKEPKARRVSSLPPKRSEFISSASDREFKPSSPPLVPASAMEALRMGLQLDSLKGDGRTWAEILEDEQATQEEEKDADEDLFKTLQQEEKKRLAQAELT